MEFMWIYTIWSQQGYLVNKYTRVQIEIRLKQTYMWLLIVFCARQYKQNISIHFSFYMMSLRNFVEQSTANRQRNACD